MRDSLSLSLSLLVCLACAVRGAEAATFLDVPDSGGLFRFHLLAPGEIGEGGDPSDFPLNEKELGSLRLGTEYWRLLLQQGAAHTSPLRIEVLTQDEHDDNASAWSETLTNGPWRGYTFLAGALTGDWFGDAGGERDKPLAFITIDHGQNLTGEWYTGPMGSLPQNGTKSDLASTVLHELGHALGLSATLDGTPSSQPTSFFFSSPFSLWTQGLRDSNGQVARPGMAISSSPASGAFVTDGQRAYSGVYFTGAHVQEVLNGARIAFASDPDARPGGSTAPRPVPGLPVNGWERDENGDFFPEFSHIELQNSLMSHQNYRNWNTFMEAELAAMQDVGLVLDRRNWYGYSIYNSGTRSEPRPFVNTHPYYARDARGGWLEGQANPTPWGTGLHVYGSWNKVTQAADLLSSGAYGLGIRVDGSGNRITVAPGVRIRADGIGGAALLVSYGKEHAVIHRGDAQAAGEGGIAARLDFGDNELGNNLEYRGSWIRTIGDYDDTTAQWKIEHKSKLADELKGALVDSFDVTGRLAGQSAALYIGPNAWVKSVNVMNGAALQGDLISMWNPLDPRVQYKDETGQSNTELTTELTFGLRADAEGAALREADPNFRLRYDGRISGPQSLNMAVKGGLLSFNGAADVLSVSVDPGATLSGNAAYRLNVITDGSASVGGQFRNAGTLSPGNSLGLISIDGDYSQTPTGRLAMEFDASGRTDRLEVSGDAALSGTLSLGPVRDYYHDPVSFRFADMVSAGGRLSTPTGFSVLPVVQMDSPTLSMALAVSGSGAGGRYTVTTSRAPDAYSRYADNGNAARAGRGLDRASGVRGDLRNVFAALDFSAPDGSGVTDALPQLSPDAYGNAALGLLDAHRMMSDLVLSGALSRTGGAIGNPERRAFVLPYAGYADQPRSGGFGYTAANAGIIAGVERSSGESMLGVHAAFNHLALDGEINGRLRGEGFYLGGQGVYAPESWRGWNIFGVGRVGPETIRMKRAMDFNGYKGETDADWLGFSGAFRAGAGWETDFGAVGIGPFAALDYAFSFRPDLTEGGSGARLRLESKAFQSLRSSLGARLATRKARLNEHAVWQARASLAWNHELLDRAGDFRASFAEASGTGFSNTVDYPGRDSLSLAAGLTFATDADFSLSLHAGSELFRRDGHSVYGRLSAVWRF